MADTTFESETQRGWFGRFVINTLRRYASTASADRIFRKYSGLPKDVIAERYIRVQARAAALAGAVSALTITGSTLLSGSALVSTVGVPLLAITVPAGIAALAGETAYTLRLQVRTAYDLCLLYGVPLDPDDPEDLWEIFLIGMGAEVGDSVARALRTLVPRITQQQVRRLLRKGLIRRRIQAWAAKSLSREFARRYLAEGFLLKVAAPGASMILGSGWNYLSTTGIANGVKARIRGQGMSIECIERLEIEAQSPPSIVLATALNMLMLNSRVHENEIIAYECLGARLQELYPDFDPKDIDSRWADQTYWLAQVALIKDTRVQRTILLVAETIAILDGRIRSTEVRLLKRINRLFGLKFDRKRLKAQAGLFYTRPPGQGCRIAALILASGVLLASFVCLISLVLLARGWMIGH